MDSKTSHVVYVKLGSSTDVAEQAATSRLAAAINEFTMYEGVTYDIINDLRNGSLAGVWLVQKTGERIIKVEV